MPVPKRKTSKRRRDKRFANKGLKAKPFTSCPNCNESLIPHVACPNCGMYKGKKVIATKLERTVKRGEIRKVQAEKKQAREAQATAPEQNQKQ